jgi:predicted dehydrogenase
MALGTSVAKVAEATGAQAVINVTVPAAHHPVNIEAMFAGLPVLCEKPVAPTVAEGLSLAAAAEVSRQLLMISQSRRYFHGLTQLKSAAQQLGDIGVVTTEFFKAPHFGGFREEMAHVLLVDMAIHQFDAARFLLDQDPESVYCEEFNPSWSWYRGDAAATAVFQMSGGTRYAYTGSWCADGLETSWNGTWRVNGAAGTAAWDGERQPLVETTSGIPQVDPVDHAQEIAGALQEFVAALRTGAVPSGEVHSNVLSLAMVEAAVESAALQQRVLISDVVEEAYRKALASEQRPDVRAALAAWDSPHSRIGASAPAGAASRTALDGLSPGGTRRSPPPRIRGGVLRAGQDRRYLFVRGRASGTEDGIGIHALRSSGEVVMAERADVAQRTVQPRITPGGTGQIQDGCFLQALRMDAPGGGPAFVRVGGVVRTVNCGPRAEENVVRVEWVDLKVTDHPAEPSLGCSCQFRYGDAVVSMTFFSVMDVQLAPPSTLRKMSSTGPHRPSVATMTLPGLAASTASPAYPKPSSVPVLGRSGVMSDHMPAAGSKHHTSPSCIS